MKSVIVVGAGVAGMAAAGDLLRAGWRVTMLEARGRVGGRLYSLRNAPGVPVDLGPEFLHGEAEEVKALVDPAEVVGEATEASTLFWKGELQSPGDLMDRLATHMKALRSPSPDAPVAELFSRLSLSPLDEAELRNFIEGFNALDVNSASQSAFKEEARLSEESEKIGRLRGGYASILPALERNWREHFTLSLETRVTRIAWAEGRVRVFSEGPLGERVEEADRIILTLPPPLLADVTCLRLEPELPAVRKAARALPMGPVHKVVFVLKKPLWDTEGKDIAFLHSPGLLFGIRWIWTVHEKPLLVCWSGGARSAQLNGLPREAVIERALQDTATSLLKPLTEIKEAVEQSYYHDWVADPFSRGAYTYVRLKGAGSREELARPVAGTIFFAGEATASSGDAGTVHGAIRTGRRAAREVRESAA